MNGVGDLNSYKSREHACNPLMEKVNGFGRFDSMISQFLTVKLLRGSFSSASEAGFCLNPMKRPSSFRMK